MILKKIQSEPHLKDDRHSLFSVRRVPCVIRRSMDDVCDYDAFGFVKRLRHDRFLSFVTLFLCTILTLAFES